MRRAVFFPSTEQELLLKAALLDGREAVDCWNAWRAAIAIDDLDIGSQRLLPLLYKNLHRLGVNHPDMARYKSVHRYIWVANQLRIRQMAEILAALEAGAVPALLLKGIALASLCYGDIGQRPMADLDFLVPSALAATAGRILHAAGWQSPDLPLLASTPFRSANHAMFFVKHGTPIEVDLHWHVAHEVCGEPANAAMWAHAQDLEIGGVVAHTLSDTDHLFLICIHGARPNEVAPIRWVADAMLLLRRGNIDWPRLVAQIHGGDFSHRMTGVLRYLRDVFAASIPAEILDELAGRKFAMIERFETLMARRRRSDVVTMLGQFWSFYWRNPNYRTTPVGLLGFMHARWGATSLVETASQGLQRTMKHIVKRP
jgi:Uncharacterised nucleotidyltransferase